VNRWVTHSRAEWAREHIQRTHLAKLVEGAETFDKTTDFVAGAFEVDQKTENKQKKFVTFLFDWNILKECIRIDKRQVMFN